MWNSGSPLTLDAVEAFVCRLSGDSERLSNVGPASAVCAGLSDEGYRSALLNGRLVGGTASEPE